MKIFRGKIQYCIIIRVRAVPKQRAPSTVEQYYVTLNCTFTHTFNERYQESLIYNGCFKR